MNWIDCHKPENETPRLAMTAAKEAIQAVYKAFGAPGDYGYGHPEGDSLQFLYASQGLLVAALKKPDEPLSPCGHPASMLDRTVESGTIFCRVCDLQDRCRDAEGRERELSQEVQRLRPIFAAARVFAESMAKFPNAAMPNSPARRLFDAVNAASEGVESLTVRPGMNRHEPFDGPGSSGEPHPYGGD